MAKLTRDNIPFTQVANEVLNDKRLSFRTKGIYAYMFSKPDDWDFSAERIMKDSNESEGRKSILASIKELKEAGWLISKKKPSGRVEYYLNSSSEPQSFGGTLDLFPHSKVPLGHRARKALINNTNIDIQSEQETKLPSWLNLNAWGSWMAYRKELGKKQTPTSIRRQIKFLGEYRRFHTDIIDTSIRNGWTGLFAPKGKENLREAITDETPKQVGSIIKDLAGSFSRI